MSRYNEKIKYNGKKLGDGQIAILISEEVFLPDTLVTLKEDESPWLGFDWQVHDSKRMFANVLFSHCLDSPDNRLKLEKEAHNYRIKYGTNMRTYDVVIKTKKGITVVTPLQGTEDKSARTA